MVEETKQKTKGLVTAATVAVVDSMVNRLVEGAELEAQY